MPDIGSKAVASNVAGPFKFCNVGMTRSYVSGLQLHELLLSTEFIGLDSSESETGINSRG